MPAGRRSLIPEDGPQLNMFKLSGPVIPEHFRKATQVVHSTPKGSVTLIQRRLMNRLLKNAMETTADSEGFYSIQVGALAGDIGFDSRNRQHLINSANLLMRVVFEWDVIASERKRVLWKASVLFPEVEVTADGQVRYQISNQMLATVLNPEMYALIDMNVVNRLRRSASIPIYEHCARYVKLKRTADVPWEKFRDIILGESTNNKSYEEYKYFKAKVLSPSITEINAETDLVIELVETKQGRRITALRFNVDTKQDSSSLPGFRTEAHLEVVGEMIRIGLLQSEAMRVVEKVGEEAAKAAVTYTRKRMADKKLPALENAAAYLRRAITEGWGIVDIPGKPPAPHRESLEDQYAKHQQKEAAAYFRELDEVEQAGLVKRYNEQQATGPLRINPKKVGKAAEVAFQRWLATDTWGTPSSEDLLEFARHRLESRG